MFPYYRYKKKKKKSDDAPKERKPRKKREKPDLVKRLDKVFAVYIRLRDIMPSGYGKCISCGKIKPYKELDCGHFYGRTNMATRFDEDNCHAECIGCNRVSADHLIYYQENLIRKIGVSRFEALRARSNTTKKYSDDELEEKIARYTAEVHRLSRLKDIKVNI